MCKIMEDMRDEAAREIATRLIESNKMSLDEIAEATSLPFDVVKELENSKRQPA